MLSIGVIKSSAAAVSYYEKDDYYAREESAGEVPSIDGHDELNGGTTNPGAGIWWGEGAERLGLNGAVDPATFREVLEGRLPNGATLGTTHDGKWVHRPGWDLTFSAPKSVSIAAEVGGDARIFKAHDAAVRTAMTWLQTHAAAHRQRDGGDVNTHQTDNLAVALFRHDVSRDQEPQLHTHAVIANATQRADGQWVSLTSEPLFDHKMAAGNVYRAELAQALRALGYDIERTHKDGRFEIAGIPDDVARAFSSRREAIERALVERGMAGPIAAARAALLTRHRKTHVARSALVPRWQALARELGFDAAAFVDKTRAEPARQPPAVPRTYEALREAISRLSEHEAVFSHADLVRWSLAAGIGDARVDDVERTMYRSPELIRSRLDGRAAWTTPAAVSREQRVLAALEAGRCAVPAIAAVTDVSRDTDGDTLDAVQRSAVAMIATTTDRLVGVLGRPGTGKTRTLGAVRTVLEAQGYQAVGMATNAEAARVLTAESGITASTVRRHLGRVSRDIARLKKAKLTWTAARIRAPYERQVWIVDEASQLNAADARRLTTFAETLGARIVLVGDTAQLPAIAAGRPFGQLLEAGMAHVELDNIRRQHSANDVAAIRDVIGGDVQAAMARLHDKTQEIASAPAQLDAIVAAWSALPDAARATTTVLTARNLERAALNDAMRDVLRREGKLAGEHAQSQLTKRSIGRADQRLADSYATGDVVRFGRGVEGLGIAAGEYLRVTLADNERNVVLLARTSSNSDEPPILWNPREVAGGAINGVEVYRPRENSVAPGERIAWSRNQPDAALTNGQVVTVLNAQDGAMTLKTAGGKVVRIDTTQPEGQHWDHAYATTIYKSQGRTTTRTLVNAESDRRELFSQKAFLVAISRHTDTLRVFVDDKVRFTEALFRHAGEKTSAVDAQRTERLNRDPPSKIERAAGFNDRRDDLLNDREQDVRGSVQKNLER